MSDSEQRDAFLSATHFCVLGTLRRDGRARLSPMSMAYDGGVILITTRSKRAGAVTARRDPRVTVCCFNPAQRRSYVNVSGRAEVLADEALFLRHAELTHGRALTPDELDEQKRRYVEENRVVLRITPEEFYDHIV